jgi:NAD(P)-dependent dehydrogenase (short-subunit alcohol dehydrogenase family)
MQQSLIQFEGKVAVVTGGAKGIGADIAEKLLVHGAAVVIVDVDEAAGAAKVEGWRQQGYTAHYISCDITSQQSVQSAVTSIEELLGGIHILVNNAGVFPRATLLNVDDAHWNKVMDVNLKGALYFSQGVVQLMSKQGGSMINIGSLHHHKGQENTLVYALSKGGMMTFTRSLASSLAKHKIRVNGINPGWVMSEGEQARIQQDNEQVIVDRVSQMMPFGGVQTGEDIANAVVFLASNLASQITGQIIAVDGGMSSIL